jgi:hypothetical protein
MKLYHPKQTFLAFYYGLRWRIRRLLRVPDGLHQPVLDSSFDEALSRHRRICSTLLQAIPDPTFLKGATVAEIGCGDCLAAADMMLGLGARHVHLVDHYPIIVNDAQRRIVESLSLDTELPNRGEALTKGQTSHLRDDKLSAHAGLLESVGIPEPVDLIYSFDVLEHVEDLDGFFAWCARMAKPGSYQIHKFDLSGHEFFEDPIPPLDFQTHPTWLFNLIFPKYRRAAGHFADEIFSAISRHGFEITNVTTLRRADDLYLGQIWPHLRAEARSRPRTTIALLDVVVRAVKRT